MFTDEELREAGDRARASRKAQGLPPYFDDVPALALVARDLERLAGSDAPVADDALGVPDMRTARTTG